MSRFSAKVEVSACFAALGLELPEAGGGGREARSPIDGSTVATLADTGPFEIDAAIAAAAEAFVAWREIPAPRRGALVRLLGEELRAAKAPLGRLVSLEAGKIVSEGLGEVQEMIDVCEFAVGLSRQLHGLVIASERPGHRMMESWHPLGPALVISAFNFPVAVWAWNAALALVCGDPVIWKPSEKTPLTAIAVQGLFDRAARAFGDDAPAGLAQLVIGGPEAGARLVDDPRIALISATGSTRMGRIVAERAARRFARTILELGGNNAAIICPSADLELTLRAVAFSAIGTAGQRCTSLRRLFIHRSIYADFVPRLIAAFAGAKVGNPLEPDTLVGPLIDSAAPDAMTEALDEARALGAIVHGGERVAGPGEGVYVRPALVELATHVGPVLRETFAPILYVVAHDELAEAIALNNSVTQGLSSSIFTNDLREAERFLAAAGSDCGIANVNTGASGAEIGGAFGGEKETGGGRESGSDAWKGYMRRATNTVNFSCDLPLAQGVEFEI